MWKVVWWSLENSEGGWACQVNRLNKIQTANASIMVYESLAFNYSEVHHMS